MKKWIQETKGLLMLLLVMAVCLVPKAVFADTEVVSGQKYTADAGDIFLIPTFNSATDVLIETEGDSLEILHGKYEAQSVLSLTEGMALMSIEGNSYKFKIKSGRGSITFTWVESNDFANRAVEFTLKQGKKKVVDDAPRYRYYLLNVKESSGKYTFTANNSTTDIQIVRGKVETESWPSSTVEYKIDDGESDSFVLTQGYYTICGTSFSNNVQMTIKREKWVGITKITPSNKGKITGIWNTSFEYVVKYEPKNADSVISVASASSQSTRMTLKSQSNGRAVFTVDFTVDDAQKKYLAVYSKDATSRSYNKVRFTSEEGVTAEAEKMVGPGKPYLDGTLTGSTKAVSIPIGGGRAGSGNKYVAYYKNGSQWKKCGQTTTNENGYYYVPCSNLKAGQKYTFRVYAYADGVKGDYLDVKGCTAYNLKPSSAKATCTKAVFHKRKQDYEWKFDWSRGWYKVLYTDYTALTIKTTFKVPKNAQGTYVTVNGQKQKSGKTFTFTKGGRSKAGENYTVYLQCVRKYGKCLAYGPTLKVKCKLKAS